MDKVIHFWRLGQHAMSINDLHNAVRFFEESLASLTDKIPKLSSEILRDMADAHFALKQWNQTYNVLKEAFKLFKETSQPKCIQWMGRAQQALDERDHLQATRWYSVALLYADKHSDQDIRPEVYLGRSIAYFGMKDKIADSKKDLEECRKLNPQLVQHQADYWLRSAKKYIASVEYDQALYSLKVAFHLSIGESILQGRVLSEFAVLYIEMKDYGNAVKAGHDMFQVIKMRRYDLQQHTEFWLRKAKEHTKKQEFLQAQHSLKITAILANGQSLIQALVQREFITVYIAMNDYTTAIKAANDLFQLTKNQEDEEEAKQWKERGNKMFQEKKYSLAIGAYSVAIKFAPKSLGDLLAPLHSNRSQTYIIMDNLSAAMKDAQKCTRLKPYWSKGHYRLGTCHVGFHEYSKALEAFSTGYALVSGDGQKLQFATQIVSLGVKLKDGLCSVQVDIPKNIVEKIVNKFSESSDWEMLNVLYLGGSGGTITYMKGEGGIATGCPASCVKLDKLIEAKPPYLHRLLKALFSNDANPNDGDNNPLEVAIKMKNVDVVCILLENGCDPWKLCTNKNDTPFHLALRLAIDSGNNNIFNTMVKLNIFKDNTSIQDGNGNTLLHVLAKAPFSLWWREMSEKLAQLKVNPQLCNNSGKQPLNLIPREDPRWQLLKTYTDIEGIRKGDGDVSILSVKKKKKKLKKSRLENNDDASNHFVNYSSKNKQHAELDQVPLNQCQHQNEETKIVHVENLCNIKERIEDAIQLLTPEIIAMARACEGKPIKDASKNIAATSQSKIEPPQNDRIRPPEQEQFQSTVLGDGDLSASDDEITLEASGKETYFDNLTWEVDCTADVWKVLRDKKLDRSVKRKIIDKIQTLAQGYWRPKLCVRLEGLPKNSDILLYEAKMTKAARIIWEQAVAFSPRCSEDPEMRVKANATAGRVYTDIIRVWDIVLDHETLSRRIKEIVKSHDRGLNCLVKRTLRGLKGVKREEALPKDHRIPNYYIDEYDEGVKDEKPASLAQKPGDVEDCELNFCPPASSHDNEYNILKFYSFNSALINSILEDANASKIDFPFKVTELEHAIINLKSELPVSIILLGRSGTGKTTCCLYRLWNEFQSYWERAVTAGPHIPRHVEFIPKENQEDEERNETEDEEADSVSVQKVSSLNKVEDAAEDEDTEQEYEHLHQIFVTKNAVLCSEVKKNFKELCHAYPAAQEHIDKELETLPPRIQDIPQAAWPLFISSRDWLLLLDASLPGDSFFPRHADGSMKRRVQGWGEESEHLTFIPEDEDEDEEMEEEALDISPSLDPLETPQQGAQPVHSLHDMDPRTEVTYARFLNKLWPKMCKTKTDYHPTLVWTEIRSFIKGSVESLHTPQGFLPLEQYESLGRKRAPYFTADRPSIYKLFEIYQHLLANYGWFDEPDMIFQLFGRLQKIKAPEWSLHRVYIDETQDFSQAELTVFIRCCRFPNHLFFTGDTAQSIMRGIAFRFEDLKSLFYYANKSSKAIGQEGEIRVPESLFQLTNNYRSHAGILELASSVIDLLLHFFPSSFDRLEKDQGLFDGPKPVLLESCRASDLAVILSGNSTRSASHIEFGAHQVILVTSDEVRNALPEELSLALVLTIYEAKGLEFNDVLIYNFFKDSQARKEWRVISKYVKDLEEGKVKDRDDTGLVEIHESKLTSYSRPLSFDPDKHKVLNSEFKYLYTAITRARQNVWLFDEDAESRSPMFEYFQRLGLVNVMKVDKDVTNALPSMFAQKSSPEEWDRQGLAFFAKELWIVALQCFGMSSNKAMIAKCNAHLTAEDARLLWQNQRSNAKKWKDKFLRAADQFLDCGMPREAAICLNNAKEFLLLAKLEVRLGNWDKAAKWFRKEGDCREASTCYEKAHNYRQAVEVLYAEEYYEPALSVVERYTLLKKTDHEAIKSAQPPKKERTIENLCHTVAEMHLKNDKIREMEVVIQRLPTLQDQITFLKEHKCVDKAASLMVANSQQQEAAVFLFRNGKFLEARENSQDEKFVANCCLSYARKGITNRNNKETVLQHLEEARIFYEKVKDKNGGAEANLLIGELMNETDKLKSAGKNFQEVGNFVGEMECLSKWMDIADWDKEGESICNQSRNTLSSATKLVRNLQQKELCVADQRTVDTSEQHFGLKRAGPRKEEMVFYPKTGCRMAEIYTKEDDEGSDQMDVKILEDEAKNYITKNLLKMIIRCATVLRGHYLGRAKKLEPCKRKMTGYECSETCLSYHGELDRKNFSDRFYNQLSIIHLDALASKLCEDSKSFSPALKKRGFLPQVPFESCLCLYKLVFPDHGGISFINLEDIKTLRGASIIKDHILKFASSTWKDAEGDSRLSDTDMFLKVSNTFQLAAGKPEELYKWLLYEQDKCAKLYIHDAQLKIPSNVGIVLSNDKNTCELYLTWWENMKHILLIFGDIIEASHIGTRRFLGMPVRKRDMPYPSIANTVAVAEFFLTLLLGFYSRLLRPDRVRNAVCLPVSYGFSIPKVWDCINVTSFKQFTFFKAIKAQRVDKTSLHKVQKQLKDLVFLVFGGKNKRFNTLKDALTMKEFSVSGEAERTLILALTMLCNCGKGIPFEDSESLILETLHRLNERAFWPERIRDAVARVKESHGIQDIISILKDLLQHRNEKLYDMHWDRNRVRLFYSGEANPSLARKFHVDIDQLRSQVHQRESQGSNEQPGVEQLLPHENVDDDFHEDPTEVGEATQQARKELAKEAVGEENQLIINTSQEVPGDESNSVGDLYRLVDESGCKLCSVTFKQEVEQTLVDPSYTINQDFGYEFQNQGLYSQQAQSFQGAAQVNVQGHFRLEYEMPFYPTQNQTYANSSPGQLRTWYPQEGDHAQESPHLSVLDPSQTVYDTQVQPIQDQEADYSFQNQHRGWYTQEEYSAQAMPEVNTQGHDSYLQAIQNQDQVYDFQNPQRSWYPQEVSQDQEAPQLDVQELNHEYRPHLQPSYQSLQQHWYSQGSGQAHAPGAVMQVHLQGYTNEHRGWYNPQETSHVQNTPLMNMQEPSHTVYEAQLLQMQHPDQHCNTQNQQNLYYPQGVNYAQESFPLGVESPIPSVQHDEQDYGYLSRGWSYPQGTGYDDTQMVNMEKHIQSVAHQHRCNMYADYQKIRESIAHLLDHANSLYEQGIVALDRQRLDEAMKTLEGVMNRIEADNDWDNACTVIAQPKQEFENQLRSLKDKQTREEEVEVDDKVEDEEVLEITKGKRSSKRGKKPKAWQKRK